MEPREIREMAHRLVTARFGAPPRELTEQHGGLNNAVFIASHDEGEFVVRLSHDPAKLEVFNKERWAIAKAREAGVPTAEVLEVGKDMIPLPYMISRRVQGHDATACRDRPRLLREMGRYTAVINAIPTSGYGWTFDWGCEGRRWYGTWREFLEHELKLDARLEVLAAQRMLPAPRLATLRSILEADAATGSAPALAHGDMRLKNVMVGDDGAIAAIIDWEHSLSAPAPHWELSVALHDLSTDDKQAFLEGYGLSERDMHDVAPVVKALNIINYVPSIERHAHDAARLARYRLRLSGALDLYSL